MIAAKESRMKRVTLWLIIALLMSLILPALSPVVQAHGHENQDWTSFNHDLRNTRASSSAVPEKINELWVNQDFGPEHFSATEYYPPIVYEDKVFVAVGGIAWDRVLDEYLTHQLLEYLDIPLPIPPKIDWTWSMLYALDSVSGEPVWDDPFPFPGVHINFAVSEGKVFVSSRGLDPWWRGGVFCIDIDTQGVIWDASAISEIYLPGMLAVTSDRVIVSASSTAFVGESIFCLDKSNGEIVWDSPYTLKQHTNERPSHIAAADDMVFFSTNENRLYGLDLQTGTELWSPKSLGDSIHHPVLTDDRIIISGKGRVYAFDVHTGDEAWRFDGSSAMGWFSPPAVADNKVFVIYDPPFSLVRPESKQMYVLYADSKEVYWQFEPPSKEFFDSDTSPVIAGDMLLFITKTGDLTSWKVRLHCVDYVKKDTVWTQDIQKGRSDSVIDGPRVAQGGIFLMTTSMILTGFSYRVLALDGLLPEEPDFLISAISDDFFYQPGDTSGVTIEITSTRDEPCSILLEIGFKDSNGGTHIYDPPLPVTLGSGETTTLSLSWQIPEDGPPGFYQIAVDCYSVDENQCQLYTDNLDWAAVLYVYKLRVLEPLGSAPAMAGNPSSPNFVLVSVEWIPSWLLLFRTPTFLIEIDNQPVTIEPMDPAGAFGTFLKGVYTLKIAPPAVEDEGLYDLKVTASLDQTPLMDAAIEQKAIEYLADPPGEPIQRGLAWLRTRQYADGSWRGSVGVTSLAVLAFLNAGYDESDTTVSKAISYIIARVRADGSIWGSSSHRTYETSLAILPLVATRNEAYKTIIGNARDWLVNVQWDEANGITMGDSRYGGFGYAIGSRPDLSNSQFALLALDASGLPKDDPLWTRAQVFLHRCQNIDFSVTLDIDGVDYTVQPYNHAGGYDGGFIYSPGYGRTSWGSMTGAGIWGLLLSGVPRTDARAVAAIDWFENNYTWDTNPGWGTRPYYYYMTMSKALIMFGQPVIGGRDWYQDLYDKLAGIQIGAGSAQGYWSSTTEDFNPDLTTAYAVLSLQTRAIAPPTQKLSYLSFVLHSNCHIRITDPDGRVVGYDYTTGQGENRIPSAVYSGPFSKPQYMVIVNPRAGSYRLELVGVSQGSYYLTIQGRYGEEVTDRFAYIGQIKPGELHGADVMVTAIVGPIDIYTTPPQFEQFVNRPPTADAGDNQTVFAVPPATTAMVTLDGSNSYDPDGDLITYTWTWDGNTAYGVNPTVEVPLGTTTIMLVVNDGMIDSLPDTVDITVLLPAAISINPESLNLRSRGNWITAYIELPEGYAADDVDIETVELAYGGQESLIAAWGDVQDGVLMAKFDWATVTAWFEGLHDVDVELTVAGEVDGVGFEGTDIIRVIDPSQRRGGR